MALIEVALSREAQYLNVLRQRIVRADVWLRMVASGAIPIGGAGGAVGTPSYEAGAERVARTVDGV